MYIKFEKIYFLTVGFSELFTEMSLRIVFQRQICEGFLKQNICERKNISKNPFTSTQYLS